MHRRLLYLALGPLSFFLILQLVDTQIMPAPARAVLASTVWIAIWWITEALPMAVTSLLPLILFPLTGGMDMNGSATPYATPIIYLYAGGFIVALAMEKWHLHKRIALNIIAVTGTNMRLLVLGFMIATGFLSMWISNTATAVMMLPIGIAIISQLLQVMKAQDIQLRGSEHFGGVLMLGIAYSASIGGMATLVGTPTNLVLAGFVKQTYGQELSFARWMAFGLPLVILLMGICWWHLVRNAYPLGPGQIPGSQKVIKNELAALGKVSFEEKWVAAIFSLVAFLWITRKPLLNPFLPDLDDTMIAIGGAVLLFILPSRQEKGTAIMDWETALKLPWGILLLFGAGFSIAKGFKESGLAEFIGLQLTALDGIPLIMVLLIIVFGVNFLTEITSNVATCTLILPILAELAPGIGVHPLPLMVGASLAASCAFMLPVATPPNAVVFGSGYLTIPKMVRAGFLLNILSAIVITLAIYFVLPLIWDIDLASPGSNWTK